MPVLVLSCPIGINILHSKPKTINMVRTVRPRSHDEINLTVYIDSHAAFSPATLHR
jgi:hypothetical protein